MLHCMYFSPLNKNKDSESPHVKLGFDFRLIVRDRDKERKGGKKGQSRKKEREKERGKRIKAWRDQDQDPQQCGCRIRDQHEGRCGLDGVGCQDERQKDDQQCWKRDECVEWG